MAERPEIYRAIRFGDAVVLAAAAGALVFAGSAQASVKHVLGASDPSVSGETLAYSKGAGDLAFVREGQNDTGLPGTDPSIADEFVAVIDGGSVRILERPGYADVESFDAPGVDAVAISNNWIVYRTRVEGRDKLQARSIDGSGETGEPKDVGAAGQPDQVSAPSLDGNTLVYAIATPRSSRIIKASLKKLKREVVIRSDVFQLFNPSVRGSSLLYVRGTKQGWELRLKGLGNRDTGRQLRSSDRRLWSTALNNDRAYYTVLKGSAPTADIKSVQR